jgi:hypothetical protein
MGSRLQSDKKELIINLLKENKSDVEIIRQTGINSACVSATTTQYWKDKMAAKKD